MRHTRRPHIAQGVVILVAAIACVTLSPLAAAWLLGLPSIAPYVYRYRSLAEADAHAALSNAFMIGSGLVALAGLALIVQGILLRRKFAGVKGEWP
jgi:hypothetical protein